MSTRTPPSADVPAAPRRRVLALAVLATVVLTADIVTKSLVVARLRPDQPVHLIGNVLMLWLTRNPGAAWSVGTGETVVFTVIAFGVVVYIVRIARKLYSLGWAIALGLLLGGAMGNLTDRIFRAPGLFRGEVVDWIAVTRYYPIFNLADSGIVCGGILMVILAMRGYRFDGTRGGYERQEPAVDPADAPARPDAQAAATADVDSREEADGQADAAGTAEPTRRARP